MKAILDVPPRPPHPTQAEERALARRVTRGERSAKEEMVARNMGLVLATANKMQGRGIDFDDLVGYGVLGLMVAIEKFDPKRRNRFSTYAIPWIRVYMARACNQIGSLIRVPEHATYSTASAMSKECVRRARCVRKFGDLSEAGQRQVDARHACRMTPAEHACRRDDGRRLEAMLQGLNARAADVLRLRYGLGGKPALTLADVADRLGITRLRVRQIESKALIKLEALGQKLPR